MPDNNKSYDLIPPQGDKDVGKRVFEILAAVLADKQNLGLPAMWKKHYRLRRNKHWKTDNASVPLSTINLVFTHLQRSINTLTDNNPIFNVVCKVDWDAGDMRQKAMDLQRAAEDWWQDEEQQTKLESSVTNGELYGITIEKSAFNADKSNGLGDVDTQIVDPLYFGWYPVDLKDIQNFQKSEAVVEFKVESVRRLRKKYPKLADKIKSDQDILDELDDNRREINTQSDKASSGSNMLLVVQNVVRAIGNLFKAADISEIDAEKTVACECWYRDDTQIADGKPEKDADGRIIQNTRLKYTGGMRYILACSGGVVLEDKDNPNINPNIDPEVARYTYLYDKFPYGVSNSIIDPCNAWGITDIEDIAALNMELNKAMSQFVLEKDQGARKKLINPKDSGVENHELTNYPSIINPSSAQQAAGIRYLEYPQDTQDIEKAIQMFKELILLVAGTFDLDQAQTKSNVVAYKAIAALLERAATMMRGKIRNYSWLIRERGRMYVSHVQNFYTEDRYITYKEGGQTVGKTINGSSLTGPINMTVVSGSTLPVSRVQQREEALSIFQANGIDREELLEKLDWSNRSEVLKRMAAGPLGQVFEMLSTTGMPAELLEYIKSVAEADPKKLANLLKTGEFPAFPQVMQQLIAEKMPQGAQGMAAQQPDPEAVKAQAEAKKMEAAAALDTARAQTEAVKQETMLAGITFDDNQMKLERAQAVHTMEQNIKTDQREEAKTTHAMDQEAHAARREDVRFAHEVNQSDQAGKREDKKLEIVSAQKNKPGFNDRGLKSDNANPGAISTIKKGVKKVGDFFKRTGKKK